MAMIAVLPVLSQLVWNVIEDMDSAPDAKMVSGGTNANARVKTVNAAM